MFTPALRSRIGVVGACLALALALSLGVRAVARPPAPPADSVRLVIDYGDGVQRVFKALPWTKGMTVRHALEAAKPGPRGIDAEFTGEGEKAFLVRIDDCKNEGGGAGKRNWLYWVNATLGDRSAGVYTLAPSDVVQWEFASRKDLH